VFAQRQAGKLHSVLADYVEMTKRETKRALALIKKIVRLNKREAELLASIPANVDVDTATLNKIVKYSPLLKRESALLSQLEKILENM
jgi:hypothetical protein